MKKKSLKKSSSKKAQAKPLKKSKATTSAKPSKKKTKPKPLKKSKGAKPKKQLKKKTKAKPLKKGKTTSTAKSSKKSGQAKKNKAKPLKKGKTTSTAKVLKESQPQAKLVKKPHKVTTKTPQAVKETTNKKASLTHIITQKPTPNQLGQQKEIIPQLATNTHSQASLLQKKLTPTKTSATKVNVENKKILELEKELAYLKEKKESTQIIKDAKGRHYCHDEHCDQPAVTDMYCRYHYLALWPQIQKRRKLLKEDYLLKTTHQLIRSFGEKGLHFLLNDLKSEKTFESALKEMNLSLLKEERFLPPSEDTEF